MTVSKTAIALSVLMATTSGVALAGDQSLVEEFEGRTNIPVLELTGNPSSDEASVSLVSLALTPPDRLSFLSLYEAGENSAVDYGVKLENPTGDATCVVSLHNTSASPQEAFEQYSNWSHSKLGQLQFGANVEEQKILDELNDRTALHFCDNDPRNDDRYVEVPVSAHAVQLMRADHGAAKYELQSGPYAAAVAEMLKKDPSVRPTMEKARDAAAIGALMGSDDAASAQRYIGISVGLQGLDMASDAAQKYREEAFKTLKSLRGALTINCFNEAARGEDMTQAYQHYVSAALDLANNQSEKVVSAVANETLGALDKYKPKNAASYAQCALTFQ